MKSILSVAAILTISLTALGRPLKCYQSDSQFTVSLNDDHQIAQILVNRNRVEFGELECREERNVSNRSTDLYCTSRNVADAGYTAHFVQLDGATHVHLSEMSFFGVKYLTTLPCYHNPR